MPAVFGNIVTITWNVYGTHLRGTPKISSYKDEFTTEKYYNGFYYNWLNMNRSNCIIGRHDIITEKKKESKIVGHSRRAGL